MDYSGIYASLIKLPVGYLRIVEIWLKLPSYLVTLGKLLWNKMPLQWSKRKFGKVSFRLPKNCRNMAVRYLVTWLP